MALFSTEFPVASGISKSMFEAKVISWIKGMQNSHLFDEDNSLKGFEDEAHIYTDKGENLILKECVTDKGFVAGARHEIPESGRIWRSEVILTSLDGKAAIRVRSQCIVNQPNARPQTPRKPYFVKW